MPKGNPAGYFSKNTKKPLKDKKKKKKPTLKKKAK
jgi:hypothetical protein